MMNYKEERPWGSFENLLDEEYCKVKRICVKPGHKLSYQFHHKRNEVWVVVKGIATVTLDNKVVTYSTVGSYSPKDKTFNNKGYYLTMEVKITSSNLWLSHYTDYQMELYSIISDLHDNKNKNFKEISNYLNDNGYKTPRNKVFTHKHTWSIYTKKNRSDKRFNRLYQPDIVNVGLDIINYTPSL